MTAMSVMRKAMLSGLCVGASVAVADAAGWVRLDQRYVDGRTPTVVMQVEPAAPAVSRLRLRVDDSPLEIDGVKVFLASGTSFDVPLKVWVGTGRETRAIDVPGGPKAVRKVAVAYRDHSENGRLALVRLLGARWCVATRPMAPAGRAEPPAGALSPEPGSRRGVFPRPDTRYNVCTQIA